MSVSDSLEDVSVQVTKLKKAWAGSGGDANSGVTCWSMVPVDWKLKQGQGVRRESLKTVSSISCFLSDRLEGWRLILELKNYNRAGASNLQTGESVWSLYVGGLEQRTKQRSTRLLWGWWRKTDGDKGTNIEKKGIQIIPKAKPYHQSNLHAKGWGWHHGG